MAEVSFQISRGETLTDLAKALRVSAAVVPQGGQVMLPLSPSHARMMAAALDDMVRLDARLAEVIDRQAAVQRLHDKIAALAEEAKTGEAAARTALRHAWVKLAVNILGLAATIALLVIVLVTP